MKLRAERGDPDAQYYVGSMYLYKQNNKNKNNKQAVHWFRKSAEQGNEDAQKKLGAMYANGEGVLQDYKKGYMRFNLARYNGADTKEGFEKITPKMTSQSINEAQAMSKKFIDSNYDNCG